MADVHAAAADEVEVAVVPVESIAERRTRKRALLENAVALIGRTREALQRQVQVYGQLDRLEGVPSALCDYQESSEQPYTAVKFLDCCSLRPPKREIRRERTELLV